MRDRLEQLLETIPSMFQNSRIPESGFGAAVKVDSIDSRLDFSNRNLLSTAAHTTFLRVLVIVNAWFVEKLRLERMM